MRNFKLIARLVCLVCFTSFFSCKKEDAKRQENEPAFIKNFGASTEKDFLIEVIDELGSPLSNTTIQIGDFTGKTDINGILLKKNARVYQKFAYIKATKQGYVTGGRSLIPQEGTNKVTIRLMQGYEAGSVSSGNTGIVSLPNGTKVEFDGYFEDANGSSYSGDVKVFIKHLSSNDKDIETKMPGMLYGERADGSESILETYGMVLVELISNSNQIIQPAKGHKAKITLPIDPSQTSIAPSSIPLWHFDEKYGYWKEEGSAVRIGNEYKGEVTHFSWWNADEPFTTTPIHFNITDLSSYPLPYINIQVKRINVDNSMATGTTNFNGNFSCFIPQNEIVELKIMNLCGEVYSGKIGPFSKETTLPIKIDIKTIKIQGTLKNCAGVNVSNGYIKFTEVGKKAMFLTVLNGEINTRISVCELGTYSLKGLDMTSLQETNTIEDKITEPITNFGSLTACNTTEEYISYSLDGGATRILTSFLECTDEPEGFTIKGKNGLESFRVSGYGNESKINGMHGLLHISYSAHDFRISPAQMKVLSYITYGKSKGEFVDIDFNGTFTDLDDITRIRSLKGTVHVRRDN